VDYLDLHEALDRLAALSGRQSEVVSLRFFGGFTVPEIADLLDVSVSTVESDFRIARAWLRHQLKGGGP
jgi:RNA polymerase sigma factor (sigma-70 family)